LDSVRASLGARAAKDFEAFLVYAGSIWEAAAPHFVFGPAPSVGSLISLGTRNAAAIAKIDSMRTMRAAIRKRVREPHLATLLERYATYNGSDPRTAPATLNCIAHVEMAHGWYGVRGGIEALVDALVRVAEKNGVVFRYGARVESVDVERRRVVGVTMADGERIRADAVVANADVAHVAGELLEARHGRRLSAPAEPSMSGYTFALRARREDDGMRAAHTVVFPDDYQREFRDIFDGGRPPRDPTVYLCAQERAHQRRGWAEDEPLFAMANAPAEPARGETPDRVWEGLEARMRERLACAGLVDARDEIVWRRSPTDLARLYPGSRGAIYGASSNGRTAAFSRPANRVAKLPGLYLASGGAHPGGGMPLCVQSGRAAAAAIQKDQRLSGIGRGAAA
jgi:1-hydroxycarotenoid 3,4-desaturase